MNESPTLGVVTTDRGLVIRGWNDWISSATGVNESGVVGRPLIDFVSAARADFYRDLLTDVIESGTPRVLSPAFHRYLIECAPRMPSAHFSHMQQRVTVAPLRNDEEVVGVLITLEDVTERLDQERALSAQLASKSKPVEPEQVTATLASEDWQLRRKAVRVLKQTATVDEVRHLLDTLRREHHDLNVLNSALRVLIATGRAVVDPLISLLKDPVPNLRMHAALGLGELKAIEAVPALIAALDDADENVRFHAIEALGRIGSSDAVDALAAVAVSGNFFLAFGAIDALSKTDDARVAPLIQSLLADEALRPAAVATLAAIGDEDSVSALCVILEQGEEAGPIASALVRIHGRYEDSLSAGNVVIDAVRNAITDAALQSLVTASRGGPHRVAAATVLTWLGARSLPVLIEMIGDRELESLVEAGLLQIGPAAVASILPKLEDSQPSVRAAAATLLGRLGDGQSANALIAALDDPDASVVAAASTALAALDPPAALDSQFSLFSHPGPAVRRAAVAAINSMGASGTAARVKQALASPEPAVRECALRVAGYFGFADSAPAIKAALADPSEDVRRAAIEQLPIIDDPEATALLAGASATETPRNRAAAAHALRLVDDHRAAAALTNALSDQDAWVRYFAALSTGEGRFTSVPPQVLADLARRDPATHVRIAAITSLANLHPDAAANVAGELAGDVDDDLAAAAVAALGSIRSREASAFLADAASSPRAAVQRAAIRALGTRPTIESVEMLAWAARLDEPSELATEAIGALCRIAASAQQPVVEHDAVEALLELAAEGTNREAVIGCAAQLSDDIVPSIASGLSSMRVAIRIATVDTLAGMRHPRASRELSRALRDEDASVRAAAVTAFAKLGSPAVARTIAAMRMSDPDTGVRHRADQACRRHGWNAGPARRA